MKNIVITGVSRGIGYELANALAENNSVLGLTSSNLSSPQIANLKIEQINFLGDDLRNNFSEIIKSHFSKVDILINNAGFLINKPFQKITRAEIEKIYAVNVFGAFEMIQAIVPFMNPNSHIINIGSMGGFQGSSKFAGLNAYSSSKAAIANLTECLAEELKEIPIQVNCLALGAVQTEMLQEAFPGYQAPLSAKEMANFIANFALTGNQFFNGKILPVSKTTP